MTDHDCPTDERLYSLWAGDEDPVAKKHVDTCSACQNQLRKLQSEATVLRHIGKGSPNPTESPSSVKFPGVIGKFIIVGIWDDNPSFVTYRGLHAVVRHDVLIQVAKSPTCESDEFQKALHAACGRWMQPSPNRTRLLDLGTFESRPYLVVEFKDGVRLDRLILQKQLEVPVLIQIFGKIARVLAGGMAPHPCFQLSSVVVDEADQPTLIDWAASAEFASAANPNIQASENITTRRFAFAFCESVLTDITSLPTAQPEVRTELLRAHHVPEEAAILIAKAVTSETSLKSLLEIADALRQVSPKPFWKRLLRL